MADAVVTVVGVDVKNIAKLQIEQNPNHLLKNLEGSIFVWLFVCLVSCRHTFDILMLLWPLKMLFF